MIKNYNKPADTILYVTHILYYYTYNIPNIYLNICA